MLTTNPQDYLFSSFTGDSSGINITIVINKKVVIWACTQINDWCFIQSCSVESLLVSDTAAGTLWSCICASALGRCGHVLPWATALGTGPRWLQAGWRHRRSLALPSQLSHRARELSWERWELEGVQKRALAHQLLLLEDGGHRVLLKTTTVPKIPALIPHRYCCLGSSLWAPGGKAEASLVAGTFGSHPGSQCPWPFRSQCCQEDINHLQGKRRQQGGLNPKRCQHQSPRGNTKPVAGREEAEGGSGAFWSSSAQCCGCPECTPGAVGLFRSLKEEEIGCSPLTKGSRSTER